MTFVTLALDEGKWSSLLCCHLPTNVRASSTRSRRLGGARTTVGILQQR